MNQILESVRQWVRVETHDGAAVTLGDARITPRSQAITFGPPPAADGVWGYRWVWNRPHSYRVERGGESQTVPIVDVTRWALIAMAVGTVLVALLAGSRRR